MKRRCKKEMNEFQKSMKYCKITNIYSLVLTIFFLVCGLAGSLFLIALGFAIQEDASNDYGWAAFGFILIAILLVAAVILAIIPFVLNLIACVWGNASYKSNNPRSLKANGMYKTIIAIVEAVSIIRYGLYMDTSSTSEILASVIVDFILFVVAGIFLIFFYFSFMQYSNANKVVKQEREKSPVDINYIQTPLDNQGYVRDYDAEEKHDIEMPIYIRVDTEVQNVQSGEES
jgi:lysylphosphatidylglycerol synthetase-like protein (DUF2156 family)